MLLKRLNATDYGEITHLYVIYGNLLTILFDVGPEAICNVILRRGWLGLLRWSQVGHIEYRLILLN